MKKIVSIALAIALICFMIASTAFANETAVLKVETTTTSVQQGENVVIKISMSSNTTKNIAAIGFNVYFPDSFEYVSHTLASGLPENAVYTNSTGTFGCYNGQLSGDFEIVTITYKVKEAADAGDASVGIKNDDDLSVTDVEDSLVDLTINPCTLTITPPHVHQWSTNWTSDGTHHWHECTAEGCTLTAGTANSEKGGYAEHNWTAANCTTAKTCSIITPTQPGDSKPAEGNPSTGAVSSPVGYIAIGLAGVGALCLGAKKLTKKHED